ncbi:cystine/glutamate transporter-like [Argonauta hians]
MKNRKLVLNAASLNGVDSKETYHNHGFISDCDYTLGPDGALSGTPVQPGVSVITDACGINTPPQPEKPPQQETIGLKKSISLGTSISLLVAMVGHVSIFISPTAIFKNSGSVGVSLIIWLIGGLGNLLQALITLELAAMFPACGGIYLYVLKILGPLPAFIILWGYNLLIIGPFWAFLSNTASIYLLKIKYHTCDPPDLPVKLLAGWILLSCVALNCIYTRFVTRCQSAMAATKIITLLLVISGGIYSLTQGETTNFKEPFVNSKTDVASLVSALLYSIFSYGGWTVITALSEDMKNSARDLPKALLFTFFILITSYILINAAYYTSLTPYQMISSSSVALDFTQHIYEPLTPLVSVLVAVSSIGALIAAILAQPRFLFAAAKFGHSPTAMRMLHQRFKTPWLANFTLCLWALVLLFTGESQHFMEILGSFAVYSAININLCHLYYRWKEPQVHRPYRVNICVPVYQLVFYTVIMTAGMYTSQSSVGLSIYILLGSIPVYWVCVCWKKKPKDFLEFVDKTSTILQRLFNMRVAE